MASQLSYRISDGLAGDVQVETRFCGVSFGREDGPGLNRGVMRGSRRSPIWLEVGHIENTKTAMAVAGKASE
jgi:hypothetical protein